VPRLITILIDHRHSQQPVSRGFPLFKRCEWLMIKRTVVKRIPPTGSTKGSDIPRYLNGERPICLRCDWAQPLTATGA